MRFIKKLEELFKNDMETTGKNKTDYFVYALMGVVVIQLFVLICWLLSLYN